MHRNGAYPIAYRRRRKSPNGLELSSCTLSQQLHSNNETHGGGMPSSSSRFANSLNQHTTKQSTSPSAKYSTTYYSYRVLLCVQFSLPHHFQPSTPLPLTPPLFFSTLPLPSGKRRYFSSLTSWLPSHRLTKCGQAVPVVVKFILNQATRSSIGFESRPHFVDHNHALFL